MSNQQPVCLITGANSGIGYATSLELALQGCTVVMVCRSQHRGYIAQQKIIRTTDNSAIHLLIADLSSQRAIHELIADIQSQFPTLSILINNVGAIFRQRTLTIDGLEQTFALNHIAYFMLANGLLETLQANMPARILNVGSFAAQGGKINFDDLQGQVAYHRVTAYQQSKLANLLFTTELARRLNDSQVTINCYNPGNVRTGFGGIMRNLKIDVKRFLFPAKYNAMQIRSQEQAGKDLATLALDSTYSEITGKCFSGQEIDDRLMALDDETTAKRLWDVSENLAKYRADQ